MRNFGEMSLIQHLLGKLAEEAMEVGKICLKAQQFGFEDHHPDKEETNRQAIWEELDDLQASIEMLNDIGLNYTPDRDAIDAKKEKVVKYLHYSVEQGMIHHAALDEYEG